MHSSFDITQMLSPKSSARPMSPAKSARTQYPPLPESTMSPTQRTLSPNGHYERERRHTKTPSIAPSESASQIPRARSSNSKREKEPSVKPTRSEVDGRNSSGGSRGERSRADREYIWSCFQLKFILTRRRIASNVARSQSQPGPAPMSPRSQSQMPMNMPMSPRSQALSAQVPMTMPLSPRSRASRTPGPASAVLSPTPSSRPIPPSAIANANAMFPSEPAADGGDLTPTPSRPVSPVPELTNEEQRLIDNYFTAGTGTLRPSATGNTQRAGTRTSYAPSAMAPSALEPEVLNSHYHDGELCQLLHALDQPMTEPVKKAVRKAVRARVKKLGMKYDNEVGAFGIFSRYCVLMQVMCSPSDSTESRSMTTTPRSTLFLPLPLDRTQTPSPHNLRKQRLSMNRLRGRRTFSITSRTSLPKLTGLTPK